MEKQHQIFFDFLRFCIGSDSEIPSSLKEADWKELYAIAKKQCLVGVLFDGIKKLPAEHVGMEKELLLHWMAEKQMLEKANVRLNDAAIQVSEWFRKKGFRTCILKGQGNALMYPNPYSRTPGDIDIWVEGGDKRVISFVRSISPHEKACYHHIEFPSYKGVEVEVHYRPSFLLCFWHNRKLQKYYERVKEEQFSHRVMLGEQGEIAIPTVEFNLIFQLTHIFSHLMNEGIGLRQLVDYYYVICDFYKVYQKTSKITPSLFTLKEGSTSHPDPLTLRGEGGNRPTRCSEPLRSKDGGPSKVSPDCAGWDRLDGSGDTTSACSLDAGSSSFSACSSVALDVVQRELKHLGLWKFAQAVMFVMKVVFGLTEDRMIAPMDEKEGIFLLDEIMRGGNFGQYDDRMGSKVGESKIHRYFRMNLRNLRFVKHYPTEAVCEPVFRTWFAGWKFINRIK